MSVDTVTATTDRSHEADIVSSRTDQPSHGDDRMSPHREGAGPMGLGSVAFSAYVSNFGSYNETYGSIAAVIVLMLWLYLSAFAILVGAEVDALRERDEDVIQSTPPEQ
jgi:hypothetical protein